MQNIQLEPKIINHWIIDHLKNAKCKICNGTDYQIASKPFELREFHGGVLKVGAGGALVLVPMVCQTCKHVEFFSAIAIMLQNKLNRDQAQVVSIADNQKDQDVIVN